SIDASRSAAPGQLTLEQALAIYGGRGRTAVREPNYLFAVVGNPAGHSLSPAIHNPLFRRHRVSAAYTIASVERFDEVAEPFSAGRIRGLSITSPFKDDALAFAKRIGADIRNNARAADAVNTLVTIGGRVIADNTDVDGFEILLRGVTAKRRQSARMSFSYGRARHDTRTSQRLRHRACGARAERGCAHAGGRLCRAVDRQRRSVPVRERRARRKCRPLLLRRIRSAPQHS